MRRWVALTALIGSACSSHEVIGIELTDAPFFDRMDTMILGFGPDELYAIRPKAAKTGLEAVPVSRDAEATIFARVYEAPIGDIDAPLVGPIEKAEAEDSDVAALPIGDGDFRAVVGADADPTEPPGWIERDLPSEIRELESPAFPTGCARFEAERFQLGTDEGISAVEALDDGSALIAIGRANGRFELSPRPGPLRLFVLASGQLEPLDRIVTATLANYRINAIEQGPDGTIYLSATNWTNAAARNANRYQNHIFAGTIADGFERLWSFEDSWIRTLAIGRLEPRALLAVHDNGELRRIDLDALGPGETFTIGGPSYCARFELQTGEVHAIDYFDYCGALIELPDDRIFVSSTNGRTFHLYDPSAPFDAAFERVPVEPVSLSSLSVGPANGSVVALTRTGSLIDFFELDLDRRVLERTIPAVPSQAARAIIGFEDGFLFSGTFGFVTQFVPGRAEPFCPSNDGIAGSTVLNITPLTTRELLLWGWTKFGDSQITKITAL